MRWPTGFVCPSCGLAGDPWRYQSKAVLRCSGCKKDTSLKAGTIMQASHMPLSVWFLGAYLMTTQTPGQSALQFQRQLGLTRYETAFGILHKLRVGMVRPERDVIGGEHRVEIDECLVGGRVTRPRSWRSRHGNGGWSGRRARTQGRRGARREVEGFARRRHSEQKAGLRRSAAVACGRRQGRQEPHVLH